MSSNSFSGPGPDIASLLSMIQGGGQQHQSQQQQQNASGMLPNSVPAGNYMQNNGGNNGADPGIMSTLLQSLLHLGQQQPQQQQQQRNPRNGLNDILSLFSAQQQQQHQGPSGSNGQGVDLGRLASSGFLGNLQQGGGGGDHQSSQPQNLASFLYPQGNSFNNQTQEQALALARMAGARLLSGDEAHEETTRDANESANNKANNKANINRQPPRGLDTNNASPFFVHRKNIISESVGESTARGRNLEPGAVAVPCRARGMPMDHNPLTAYFVINNGIQHGEDVVCSHPACRNAGVKFRYCSFCKAPVAKRNFRRRHNHGGENSSSGSDYLDDESAKLSTTSGTSSRRMISASEEEPEAKRTKLISSEDDDVETTTDSSKSSSANGRKSSSSKTESSANKPTREKAEAPDPAPKKTVQPQVPTATATVATCEADSSTATMKASGKSTSSLERRQEWAKLLEERPTTNDSESMSAWIDKILKVSEAGQQEAKTLNEAAATLRPVNRKKE